MSENGTIYIPEYNPDDAISLWDGPADKIVQIAVYGTYVFSPLLCKGWCISHIKDVFVHTILKV